MSLFRSLGITVTLFSLITSAGAREMTVKDCGTDASAAGNTFISLRKNSNNSVTITGLQNGRRFTIGTLSADQISHINPTKRQIGTYAAEAGTGLAIVGGLVVSWLSWGTAPALIGGSGVMASGAVARIKDSGINPSNLRHRYRLEECFKNAANSGRRGQETLIQVSDEKEYKRTVAAFRDLVSDMKKYNIAADNSERLPAAKADLYRRPAFPTHGSTGNMR